MTGLRVEGLGRRLAGRTCARDMMSLPQRSRQKACIILPNEPAYPQPRSGESVTRRWLRQSGGGGGGDGDGDGGLPGAGGQRRT